ncbi:hypothetical protein MIR68_001725 [Amoeboaphelidium protococcarum]|nr:hypothetical protein MIR68_010958 [Amoeboaphelidium protococcarum]KAI3640838.1 hypothetical protein MIR68_001716 [Amoeboaphelidium protococcarum]KAI3640847.1 hypothetical protein MIR68_001725 [Amoeboaphelidium protococcarum]
MHATNPIRKEPSGVHFIGNNYLEWYTDIMFVLAAEGALSIATNRKIYQAFKTAQESGAEKNSVIAALKGDNHSDLPASATPDQIREFAAKHKLQMDTIAKLEKRKWSCNEEDN